MIHAETVAPATVACTVAIPCTASGRLERSFASTARFCTSHVRTGVTVSLLEGQLALVTVARRPMTAAL